MILTDMYTTADENSEDKDLYLIFEFDNGRLAFECPIGASAPELISVLKQFALKTELILSEELTIH